MAEQITLPEDALPEVDWSNPLTTGLSMFFPVLEGAGDNVECAVTGDVMLLSGGSLVWNDPYSFTTSPAAQVFKKTNPLTSIDGNKSFTLNFLYNAIAGSASGFTFTIETNDADPAILSVKSYAYNSSIAVSLQGVSYQNVSTGLNTPQSYGLQCLTVVNDVVTQTLSVYIDGLLWQMVDLSTVHSSITTSYGDVVSFGFTETSSVIPFSSISYWYDRALTQEEVADLNSNPYQLCKTGGGETPITVTATLSSYSYSANSAQVELSGEINVTTAPASYQYTPKIATVDLTGELNVLAGVASYTYSENQATISLTGDINITTSTATYNYQSLKAAVDLTGEIIVNQALASYAYFPLLAKIETVSTINVSASTHTYNYQANTATIDVTGTITVTSAAESYLYQSAPASISLFGEINVSAELASYNYSALSAIIGTGDIQQIGSVSTSFKESPYTVKYKLNNITVNFKG